MGYEDFDDKIQTAKEIEIIYAALDDIMSEAVATNWEFAVENDYNFRDACLVKSMSKLHHHLG